MARLPRFRSDARPGVRLTSPARVTVRVLLRPDCHLCHQALDRIRELVGSRSSIVLEPIDIESDRGLFTRNLERIPVVEVEGEVVSELEFDEAAFTAAIGRTPDSPGQ